MAASASSGSSAVASLIGCPVTERLARNNHALWKVQVMLAIHGAKIAAVIDSKILLLAKTFAKDPAKPTEQEPNPEYDLSVAKDQQVLNFLLASISRDILMLVAASTTAVEAWDAIEAMFASQSRACDKHAHVPRHGAEGDQYRG